MTPQQLLDQLLDVLGCPARASKVVIVRDYRLNTVTMQVDVMRPLDISELDSANVYAMPSTSSLGRSQVSEIAMSPTLRDPVR